MIVFFLKAYTL